MIKDILRPGLELWHSIAGENTAIERHLKQQFYLLEDKIIRSQRKKKINTNNKIVSESSLITDNYTIFWSAKEAERKENKIGIYVNEGCDLLAIFACIPMIQPTLQGSCCIFQDRKIGKFRSDMLINNYLNNYSPEILELVINRLDLPEDSFKTTLFEPYFIVEGINGKEEFDKNVIILTIGRDYKRAIYKHKEHGFLIDPGIWWLNQSMDSVLKDLPTAQWFRKNFTSIGKMTVADFQDNFGQLITLLTEKTNAHILAFNLLTLNPGDTTHNYQFIKKSERIRRLEFNLALAELSSQLNFSIVDMDHILKKNGIAEMPDFVHYPNEFYPLIAEEIFAIFKELEIF
ncbi:hypothetical protein [Geminocystis sp. GBBB08]|uniref:hypothetical protein n=1 Tax=Geminocystis sp. GBBB08 TaxID=2604140 RepID=UPI0027E2FFA9|nr:hypothetical protein [Geminocystis sp. GBBB08]MBL1209294.1 SGNH/GDSL hydrolase family protein [Geminocystis sp. GBBB08]